MAANADTALQINYKLPDGTLVNVYAKDQKHLEELLTAVADTSTLILATASAIGANTTTAGNMANVKVQLGAEEVKADKQCKHGAMQFRSGTGAKGAWQAWMCPAKKGDPTQCEPVWIR